MKIAIVLGTRPEAIKLAPVARRFLEVPHEFETCVVVTAQHRGLLDQTLQAFAITPDYDLDVMRAGQTLAESTSRMVAALDPVLALESPDLVVVQGDTTTTFCGALGAFYRGIAVAHVVHFRDPLGRNRGALRTGIRYQVRNVARRDRLVSP